MFKNSVVRFRAVFFIVFFSLFLTTYSQNRISLDTINNTVYIGEFKLKIPSSVVSKYIYDQESNLYIYQSKIGEIDYKLPITLTPQEYRNLFKNNFVKYLYFRRYLAGLCIQKILFLHSFLLKFLYLLWRLLFCLILLYHRQ